MLKDFEKKIAAILHVIESIIEVECILAIRTRKFELAQIIPNRLVDWLRLKLFFAAGTFVIVILIHGVNAV